jgi:hypothetical protein
VESFVCETRPDVLLAIVQRVLPAHPKR